MHDVHDQEGHSEKDAVIAERVRDGERGDEHRPHRNQHRPPHRAHTGIDGVRQPGVGRPRPPEHAENQQTMSKPTPRRIVRQPRRDLRQREHEHEIEEELERRYALLTLSVKHTHERTLARPDRDRGPTTSGRAIRTWRARGNVPTRIWPMTPEGWARLVRRRRYIPNSAMYSAAMYARIRVR